MKRSALEEYIRNQIINELSEDEKTKEDIKDTEELIAKTKELAKTKEDAGLAEDMDIGHVDDEPGMLKAELARAGKMIQMLYRAIDKYDGPGEVDFPQWWQKKIIKANAMLDSAFDYLDGQEMVAKIDAVIDNVDRVEVDVVDVMNEEEDMQKRKDAENAIRQTLKDEGGAAGLKPLVKAVKKFGFNKDELLKLLKKIVKVEKHKHGDYILTPINEEDEPSDVEIKKNKSMAKYADELARIQKDMKSLAKKYSKAEGQEKEDLLSKLKEKTKLKKELEGILKI